MRLVMIRKRQGQGHSVAVHLGRERACGPLALRPKRSLAPQGFGGTGVHAASAALVQVGMSGFIRDLAWWSASRHRNEWQPPAARIATLQEMRRYESHWRAEDPRQHVRGTAPDRYRLDLTV